MPAFTSFFNFLLLPLPRHPLNEQISWRLRCSASARPASRELAQSFLPAPFFGLPLGVSTRRGALPLIQPKPRPRVTAFVSPPSRPQPRAAWAGAFPGAPPPWAPLAAPTPVGFPPHRAPQMPGLSRNGAPPPSPTPHVNITERPPQPPLR